ncbi:MAG: hypothetical protein J6W08_03585 [Alphaproteobacteria bacterium]|nr:hypothetical protein [Alphaproteobacteria bacterium]
MKKLLSISVIAALAALPMAANATAADVNKQPTSINMEAEGAAAAATAATANTGPKYELAEAHSTDSNVATAGYVKGAYNAAIRAVNNVAGQVDSINTNLSGKANTDLSNVDAGSVTTTLLDAGAVTTAKIADNAVDTAQIAASAVTTAKIADENVTKAKLAQGVQDSLDLADSALQSGDNISALENDAGYLTSADLSTYAKQSGVEKTVKDAIAATTATVDLSNLDVTNGGLTGSGTASIDVMDTWGATSVSATPVTSTVSLTGVTTNVALTGDSSSQSVSITAPTTVTYSEPSL